MAVEQRRTVEIPRATPDDVAALLTARTKDEAGNELGFWSDKTRPTEDEVETRIEIARSLVLKQTGGAVPEACLEGAESAVAVLAAMITEAAFWPEQTVSNQSTYQRLEAIYNQARDGLLACVARQGSPGAYDLDVSGAAVRIDWPIDWWQRNLEDRP